MPGAHSWVRKSFNIVMEGEQTDYVWGVVDMTPDTDFPDIRNRCVIHSNHGSCMVIPREGDIVRLYIQLDAKDMLDAAGRRIDKNKMGPYTLLEVCAISRDSYGFSDMTCRWQGKHCLLIRLVLQKHSTGGQYMSVSGGRFVSCY
jgi:phenol 2-monooxygenase